MTTKIQKGDFPAVFKCEGLVCIVYRDHCEYYGNEYHRCNWNVEQNGKQSFDPYHEIEVCLYGNGFKRVHARNEPISFIDEDVAACEVA